ncbi:hypothetical protein [Rhodococcus sp. KRD197]|jgi:Mce-associated membrane protein|uniref:hypothetical protein n=1 Tax=Rhodococcus sp. KRD197 TaxID=2729731 RepID=UPI000AEB4EEE|nr:hypothetical protein [Rhodococcus sp. KRD197]
MSTTTEPSETLRESSTQPKRIEIRLSTVLAGLLVTALVIATCVFAALYLSVRGELTGQEASAANNVHAEQVAADYALGASTIDYRDTAAWFDNLKANTTPQLAAKFDATTQQLEQILLPLQWTSVATPITSVVTSETDGIFTVNTFLNVTSTSAQTPQGTATTVTYALTIDKNNDWKITDVGGLEGALPGN